MGTHAPPRARLLAAPIAVTRTHWVFRIGRSIRCSCRFLNSCESFCFAEIKNSRCPSFRLRLNSECLSRLAWRPALILNLARITDH